MTDTVKKITALLEMMKEHDVVELELTEGDFSVALRKHGAFAPPAAPAPAAQPAAAVVPVRVAPAAEADAGLTPIKSPIVGTFYRASSPEAEPFVQAGEAVKRDSVVCIIEAMKIMNEIRAEMEGKVERVLVESGEPVEYGQPLFLVRRG